MSFEVNQVCKGITHIRDTMGVCMTLIEGKNAALLVDTGYGVEDVHAFITSLTDKPLTVLLTHHHHDHVLGARWFDKTVMMPQDMAEWKIFTGAEKRKNVLSQAIGKGLCVSELDFVSGELKSPYAIHEGVLDLGDLQVEIIRCPGHTSGSCVVFVPDKRLLITGDDWNPCTWLFFEAALPVQEYRKNVRKLKELDFTHVLCSHQLTCFPRSTFDAFVDALSDQVLDEAMPVVIGGYEDVQTRQANVTEGQILVFDWNKYRKEQ